MLAAVVALRSRSTPSRCRSSTSSRRRGTSTASVRAAGFVSPAFVDCLVRKNTWPRASRRASRRAAISTGTRTRSRLGEAEGLRRLAAAATSARSASTPRTTCSTLAYGRSVKIGPDPLHLGHGRRHLPLHARPARRASRSPARATSSTAREVGDHLDRRHQPAGHPAARRQSPKVDLVGVASRTQERADEYAAKWGIPRAYGSYEALLADPEIEAVYISLPNTMHTEWSIKSVEAGKHVLCEKPFTRNPDEVTAAWDAADRAGPHPAPRRSCTGTTRRRSGCAR